MSFPALRDESCEGKWRCCRLSQYWLLSRSLGLSTWRGQGALGKGSMTPLSEQFPVFLNICSPLGLHHSASSAAVNPSTPASPMCPDPAPDPLPACPTPLCLPVPPLPPTPEINSGESDYPESPLLWSSPFTGPWIAIRGWITALFWVLCGSRAAQSKRLSLCVDASAVCVCLCPCVSEVSMCVYWQQDYFLNIWGQDERLTLKTVTNDLEQNDLTSLYKNMLSMQGSTIRMVC